MDLFTQTRPGPEQVLPQIIRTCLIKKKAPLRLSRAIVPSLAPSLGSDLVKSDPTCWTQSQLSQLQPDWKRDNLENLKSKQYMHRVFKEKILYTNCLRFNRLIYINLNSTLNLCKPKLDPCKPKLDPTQIMFVFRTYTRQV